MALGPLLFVSYILFLDTNYPVIHRANGVAGGRHLIDSHHRDALCSFLNTSSKLTGWPVQLIINDLNTAWQ